MSTNPERRIDIHAHYYPESFLRMVADEGRRFGASCQETDEGPIVEAAGLRTGPLSRDFIDLDMRVAEMDATGVDVHALSLTQPMVYWADQRLSQRLAAAFNDAVQAAHETYPRRLVGFATLPMSYPDLAVVELERVAGLSGIRGLYLATRIKEQELSDPTFYPVYERAEALGLPVFLHPLNASKRLQGHFLFNLLGNPFDTAVAAAHLIFGGVLDRFPNLQVCLPHAGGAFPYLVGRLQHGWTVRPELSHLERGPIEYLSRFTYDTIAHSAAALGYLIDLVGAERVMLGSDYCFDMGYRRPVEVVTQHPRLSEKHQRMILGDNAAALLGS